jgi:hypothetical protein
MIPNRTSTPLASRARARKRRNSQISGGRVSVNGRVASSAVKQR